MIMKMQDFFNEKAKVLLQLEKTPKIGFTKISHYS